MPMAHRSARRDLVVASHPVTDSLTLPDAVVSMLYAVAVLVAELIGWEGRNFDPCLDPCTSRDLGDVSIYRLTHETFRHHNHFPRTTCATNWTIVHL